MSTAILCLLLIIMIVFGLRSYLKRLTSGCCGVSARPGVKINKVKDRDKSHYLPGAAQSGWNVLRQLRGSGGERLKRLGWRVGSGGPGGRAGRRANETGVRRAGAEGGGENGRIHGLPGRKGGVAAENRRSGHFRKFIKRLGTQSMCPAVF